MTCTHLGQSQLTSTTIKRSSVLQLRLHLLNNSINKFVPLNLLLLSLSRLQNPIKSRIDLAEIRINEERNSGSLKGATFLGARLEEVRRMSIGEELGDDSGFGDDGAVVADSGNETTGVDGEIFGGAGSAEVDDYFFIFEAQFRESDVCSMSPGATMVGLFVH